LYRDARIELDRFIDVLYYKDYSRLVIEGTPPEPALKEAWDAIYVEYCELANDGSYNEVLEKGKEVQVLNAKITLIDGIVNHLRLEYHADAIGLLRGLGIPCDLLSDEDPEPKLKRVLAYGKRFVVQLDIARAVLAKAQEVKKSEAGTEYFDDWLLALGQSFGYAVRAKDLTVAQFCRAIKKLNQQASKKQANGD
jgi:hypothetical protein